ncbi:ComF family protein [Lapidilactobacillus wuchangensis]|uniref:ComF family protein n=1 Tax=Lapidilactobacillus wuchangensis TaxID=2486001 RepID=UPI000F7B2C76|nr:ComF family protein [Lapidilactobacillus wuchangensis]
MKQSEVCRDCIRRQQQSGELLRNQALFRYNVGMHDYFQQYKGRGDYQLRQVFAGSLRQATQPVKQSVLFVPIPTSSSHFAQRQFDPVLGLYGEVLPITPLLACHDHDTHQAQLTRQQRLRTPQYFYCQQAATEKNELKQILLLDDIYTTGTTLYHGLSALRQAGYRGKITSLTLAR